MWVKSLNMNALLGKCKLINLLMIYLIYVRLCMFNTRSNFSKGYRLESEAVAQRCSVRKGVLRNFAKFTGKYLCQSLFFNKES